MLTVALVDAILPALSTAVPAAIWFAPSAFKIAGGVHEAIPERTSRQLKVTVTEAALFQLNAFGGGTATAEMIGAVLSILRVTEADAVFPARSAAVPLMTWFAASVLAVTGGGQKATPEVLSEQVNVTTTLVLFQPKVSAAGTADAVMTGKSLSTPMMVACMLVPGPLRTWTAIVLLTRNVTGRSITVTLGLKSLGLRICVPLIEITALAAPEFRIWSVYCVLGLRMEKLLVTVTGVSVLRTYFCGPKAVNVPAWSELQKSNVMAAHRANVRRAFILTFLVRLPGSSLIPR